jgi:hypothetical protein
MRGFPWRPLATIMSAAVLCSLTLLAAGPPAAAAGGPSIDVLSSRADQVSGGDALLRVRLGSGDAVRAVTVTRDGADVTAAFRPDPGGRSLTGRVTGLRPGWNTVRARGRHGTASLRLRDFPVSGPIFSGPHQQPFLCTTERNGLGQPTVDNHDGQGLRVFAVDANGARTGQVIGWSRDCAASTVVDYPSDGEWNRRVLYHFDGGVGIGHSQGSLSGDGMLYDPGLSKRYAVI